MTKIQISKWGNSSAIRLPKAVLDELGLKQGDSINLTVENGKAIIEAPRPKKVTLAWIISETKRLGPENAPETVAWGPDRPEERIDDEHSRARQRWMTSLDASDVVWVDFDLVVGTEQAGRRPAIVLTDQQYNELYPRSVVCPITRNAARWPTKVVLPYGMAMRGAVLADQPRTVHREGRGFRVIERAPDELLDQVRSIVGELLGTSHG